MYRLISYHRHEYTAQRDDCIFIRLLRRSAWPLRRHWHNRSAHPDTSITRVSCLDCRLMRPAIERDVRAALTEDAGSEAVRTFSRNLRSLLLGPPLRGCTVMGIDPGFRHGCKIAVCGPTGGVLGTRTVYPHTWGGAQEAERVGRSKGVRGEGDGVDRFAALVQGQLFRGCGAGKQELEETGKGLGGLFQTCLRQYCAQACPGFDALLKNSRFRHAPCLFR